MKEILREEYVLQDVTKEERDIDRIIKEQEEEFQEWDISLLEQ